MAGRVCFPIHNHAGELKRSRRPLGHVLAQSWWTPIAHLADGIQPGYGRGCGAKRLLERNRQQ